MQQVLIVVLIAAAFAGVLFLAGGFEPATTPAPATSTADSTEADTTTTPTTTTETTTQPTTQPSTQPSTDERTPTTRTASTRATPTTGNQVHLEIGRVATWNGSPVQIPLWVQGNPQELDFVIQFPNHLARVLSVSSSANWDTDIVRLNEEGEIRVHAVRHRNPGGQERLLTMKFHRIDAGSARITIPVDELDARFEFDEPYDVRVEPGLLTAPF